VKLHFIYNADAGKVNALMDSLHKVVSPATYQCQLCTLTHGVKNPRKAWTAFLESLPMEHELHHRSDDLDHFGPLASELPTILLEDDQGQMRCLVGREELGGLQDVEALVALLRERLPDAF